MLEEGINPTGFIYDKFRCLQDQIPLLGGGRGGFYKKNKFFRITNNTHRVNISLILMI
ncbi:MAG: hypothetical protein ACJA2S_004883 [Cyclobacteriaceae bacterium]|jgi:hypothetical protein